MALRDSLMTAQRPQLAAALLALAGLGAVLGSVLGAAQTPPALQQGEPYDQARSRLLQGGWRLETGADPAGGCGAALPNSRCQRYPELGACSLTGLGLCRFRWRAPDGGGWAVITQGGELNGTAGMVQSWFEEKTE
jgi:hypothetical protein